MATMTGPKVRLSRRVGIPLTPKASKVMETRPYPPGDHGRGRRKESGYSVQLLEKQKLRYQYNISERQLRLVFNRSVRMSGNTGENLVVLLESRLDALVFRAGLGRTIYAARQFVNHGHVMVNAKRVDICSYVVSPGDQISIREKSRKLECFRDSLGVTIPPPYLEVNEAELSFVFGRLPLRSEVPVICDEKQIVEFYNR